MKMKLFLFLMLAAAPFWLSGCGTVATLTGMNEKCVVIAPRAQLRSSGALVAADLLEVKRGMTLEVIGEDSFPAENGVEKWYNVRASDENNTEGWIEARSVLTGKLLAESQKLAEQDKNTPIQATGQLRAASNLRLTPDRNRDDNVLQKLLGGDTFEIVAWKRIPKPENADEDDEKDDQLKANANKQPRRTRRREKAEVLRLDDKFETWYKVRLNQSISPAPAGWIYGKQVELTVPADIIYYRTGREFVAWSRIDGDVEGNYTTFMSKDKDAGKEMKPGSWVILERSTKIQDINNEDHDFDHILIIGYEKARQDHYKVFLSGRVKGYLPLRVTGGGDSRAFTVQLKGADGQLKDFTFTTYKDARGLLKVNVPEGIPKENKNDR